MENVSIQSKTKMRKVVSEHVLHLLFERRGYPAAMRWKTISYQSISLVAWLAWCVHESIQEVECRPRLRVMADFAVRSFPYVSRLVPLISWLFQSSMSIGDWWTVTIVDRSHSRELETNYSVPLQLQALRCVVCSWSHYRSHAGCTTCIRVGGIWIPPDGLPV